MQESLFHNESLPVRRRSKDVDKKELSKKTETFEHLGDNDGHSFGKTTSYVETLLHLLKSNIGPVCFAMGDAFKNGGIILSPFLMAILSIVCVHGQHILISCSEQLQTIHKLDKRPNYPNTVELSFKSGPERLQKYSTNMKTACNVFIVITQLGFCSIYFLFIGTNVKQFLEFYEIVIDLHVLIAFALILVWLTTLITNLKYLVPFSFIAIIFMFCGITITYYYAVQDLPPLSERRYFSSVHQLPLFFGTAIYAFEGISLVLPLQIAMKKPKNFSKVFGVLNVGTFITTLIYIGCGFIGYLKYGEDTKASLTLNLPGNQILAQSVMLIIPIGVLLGYALQFFVAIQIMLPSIKEKFNFTKKHSLFVEIIFRTVMVLITFTIAQIVPKLGLLFSLIGAFFSTALALVFPPIIQIVLSYAKGGPSRYIIIKNVLILGLGLVGFATGTYESLSAIIKDFKN